MNEELVLFKSVDENILLNSVAKDSLTTAKNGNDTKLNGTTFNFLTMKRDTDE